MKKSKEVPWKTDIVNDIGLIRGYKAEDIINTFSCEEAINLLVTAAHSTETENDLMRANIMSHCSHGITGQSTLSVLMGADTRVRFGYAAFAGFIAGSGKHHTNAIEYSMRDLLAFHSFDGNATDFLKFKKDCGERIIGFGHRFHFFDPRAQVLLGMIEEKKMESTYIDCAKELDNALSKKGIRINLDGVGAAIMLTQGLPPELGPLINFIGRAPAYAAHYLERFDVTKNRIPQIRIADLENSPKENLAYKKGKRWSSKITQVEQDRLITYKYDQKDIIRSWPYEDMVYLLLKGSKPTEEERRIIKCIILSYMQHHLYDRDVVTVRFSADLRVPFMYAGAAGFNAGSGFDALGKLYERAKHLYEHNSFDNIKHDTDLRGHMLDKIIREEGLDGKYTSLVRKKYHQDCPEFEELAAAVLLDMGVSPFIADLFPIVGRAPLWAAHYHERLNQGKNIFQRVAVYDMETNS